MSKAPSPISYLSAANRALSVLVLGEDLGGSVVGYPATNCTLELADLEKLLNAARAQGAVQALTAPEDAIAEHLAEEER